MYLMLCCISNDKQETFPFLNLQITRGNVLWYIIVRFYILCDSMIFPHETLLESSTQWSLYFSIQSNLYFFVQADFNYPISYGNVFRGCRKRSMALNVLIVVYLDRLQFRLIVFFVLFFWEGRERRTYITYDTSTL